MKNIVFMFLVLAITFGCGGKEDESSKPSNLEVAVTENGSNPGEVTVVATAENAEYFTIYFGDGASVTPQDGQASHTYTFSGAYVITVRAHKSATEYIFKDVPITLDFPLNIINDGYSTPEQYEGQTLVWQDEFNGAQLNEADWNFEIGRGSNGWGNNELEYYKKENTLLENGYLVIIAKRESYSGSAYTSSRLTTKDKRSFQYGRIDIRAKLPEGQGIWPALWMLGSNFPATPWPSCGEIDIMEMIGGYNPDASAREQTVYGTIHYSNNASSYASNGNSMTLQSGDFQDKFHVFSLVWSANSIEWLVDDVPFQTLDISNDFQSEFRQPFFFIFNVAVGGNWPGSPSQSTVFPQAMIVDYVRVFQ